tara:strand:+ start:3664 stop:4788 length:1125 start_codon:yes stop_codon:yes gene_type:complete
MNFDNWYQTIDEKLQLTTGKEFKLQHFGSTGVVNEQNRISVNDSNMADKCKISEVNFLDFEPVTSASHTMQALYTLAAPAKEKFRPGIIIATSDFNSKHIQQLVNLKQAAEINRGSTTKVTHWYYFSHALISLDWYRQYRFYSDIDLIRNRTFDYNYITQNRLVDSSRNYRLILMSQLEEQGLTDNALISYTRYREEPGTKYIIPEHKLLKIKQYCSETKRIDEKGDSISNQSMHINLSTHLSSFFNLVTETCFYESFNHLTEKVFRPVVMLQPFILAGTAGSLAYLKRYGFKTFDNWIDESYDSISNPFKRIDAVARVVETICSMSKEQQQAMYQEMLPTLQYNRSHFYNGMYDIVYKEMWDNFKQCELYVGH